MIRKKSRAASTIILWNFTSTSRINSQPISWTREANLSKVYIQSSSPSLPEEWSIMLACISSSSSRISMTSLSSWFGAAFVYSAASTRIWSNWEADSFFADLTLRQTTRTPRCLVEPHQLIRSLACCLIHLLRNHQDWPLWLLHYLDSDHSRCNKLQHTLNLDSEWI